MSRAPRKPQGVVLLSVLLIVALLSAIAIRMTSRHALTVAQARHSLGADLTLAYAIGAETMARQLLFRDWFDDPEKTDHFGDVWASPLAPFELNEYDNAFIEIQIRDLSSCFNLNALAGSEAGANQTRLKTLLRNLALPEAIADAWLDWVDPNETTNGFGAEDGEYLLASIPYRTPNRAAADVSELRLLANIEAEQLAALLPHVCVLPSTEQRINVNTASVEVLSSLGSALTPETLEPLVNSERRYQDKNEVTGEYPDLLPAIEAWDVKSDYFEMSAQVEIDGNLTEIRSVLHRDPTDGSLTLVHRDLGAPFQSLFESTEDNGNEG
ncbi:MAG: type II secretion system minor pseudopilin GspK [Pseudomonadales bacterium]